MIDLSKKLDAVERRFLELESALSQPGIDGKELTRLSKERAQISDVVEAYRHFRQIKTAREDAREMMNESDLEMRAMAKAEFESLEKELETAERQLIILTLPTDPNDAKNVVLEIRAGTGGEEASLFAADLLRMYTKYADRRRWRIELLSSTQSATGGYKEAIACIEGDRVYSRLKFESGVHRVQRVPATEAQGRIHTSAVTVAILPEAEEVDIQLNPNDLDISVCRSSGAGGQSVNTTDSAVRIVHKPTGLVVECQDERSQHKNKERALKILKARILEKAQQDQAKEIQANRRSQVGSGDRSERIRTYNFPQSRLTDHRIDLTLYRLGDIIEGDLDEVLDALGSHHQAELLQREMEQS
jgi:peptide chain release factor 1